MRGRDTIENLKWVRFFAAVIALALIVLVAFAMFSPRNGPNSNRPLGERYGLGEQLNTFQDNVGRSIDRRAGEVL